LCRRELDDQLSVASDEREEFGVDAKAVAAEHAGAVDAGQRQEVECECVEQLLRGSSANTTRVKLIHP